MKLNLPYKIHYIYNCLHAHIQLHQELQKEAFNNYHGEEKTS